MLHLRAASNDFFMINNDVIRSLRFTLQISEFKLVEIIKLGDGEVSQVKVNAYLKKDDEPGFEECPQNIMSSLLNGLIYFLRGKDESRPPLLPELPNNNVVLKKLRVAFALKDDDIIAMLERDDFKVSKTELSSFFRKQGHPNYRPVGDQFLRRFLKGLTLKFKTT
jgi:uncharacterized protein YehS (DUF1456 family)